MKGSYFLDLAWSSIHHFSNFPKLNAEEGEFWIEASYQVPPAFSSGSLKHIRIEPDSNHLIELNKEGTELVL